MQLARHHRGRLQARMQLVRHRQHDLCVLRVRLAHDARVHTVVNARASTLEGHSLCLVCESVIRLANKTSVSTEIKGLRILHAIALVPVCESRVDRGQRGFSAIAW
jgi:hypothetical protein